MSNHQTTPASQLRVAITLLGGVQRLVQELPPVPRADAERLLTATTNRLMRVVYQLEPARAKAAGRC